MADATVKLLRTASIVLCLIVVASFLLFAVNQTSTRLRQAAGTRSAARRRPLRRAAGAEHENGVTRGRLDETAEALTSPVRRSQLGSEWAERGAAC